jgi:hypothetical protein
MCTFPDGRSKAISTGTVRFCAEGELGTPHVGSARNGPAFRERMKEEGETGEEREEETGVGDAARRRKSTAMQRRGQDNVAARRGRWPVAWTNGLPVMAVGRVQHSISRLKVLYKACLFSLKSVRASHPDPMSGPMSQITS